MDFVSILRPGFHLCLATAHLHRGILWGRGLWALGPGGAGRVFKVPLSHADHSLKQERSVAVPCSVALGGHQIVK